MRDHYIPSGDDNEPAVVERGGVGDLPEPAAGVSE